VPVFSREDFQRIGRFCTACRKTFCVVCAGSPTTTSGACTSCGADLDFASKNDMRDSTTTVCEITDATRKQPVVEQAAVCDLCLANEQPTHTAKAEDFRLAVLAGLQPPDSALEQATENGEEHGERLKRWRQRVQTQQSDWHLCEKCAERSRIKSFYGRKQAEDEALIQHTLNKMGAHHSTVVSWIDLLQTLVPNWAELTPAQRAECQKGIKVLSNSDVFSLCGVKGRELRTAYEALTQEYFQQVEAEKAERRRNKKWWHFWI
jgi:hypothetical protein